MKCHELAEQLAQDRPDLSPVEIARLCLILLNGENEPARLQDPKTRDQAWQSACFRFELATDQHAAVAEEVDQMFGDSPVAFSPDQLWTLTRAVKVQSQMLELFTEQVSLA
ncbi:hypothetical protein SAMN06265222_11862 [Neorhodopirellula lusitana]|uniref:Uncharacterized protein n=1 Tax=Neorhodopirellula lusitana TaxID=445327 RepID=A0ABY1QP55_9BACT|nr:hypothetical protein [Neorhodopirellula lusitana]SMP74881.1 hypothetical protein SAMN06265222_11862 [Neorhodopirellula lusitana]